jgi:acyl carrier protein
MLPDVDVICKTLTDLFSSKLNLDVPSYDTELLQSGILDSMMLVELLVVIEREFGVTVSVETLDIDQFGSLASIARMIQASGS